MMRSMRFGKRIFKKRQSGQALIETVLVLWFLMLPILLNAINMAYATIEAFKSLSTPEQAAEKRGLDVKELVPWLEKARKTEADNASY